MERLADGFHKMRVIPAVTWKPWRSAHRKGDVIFVSTSLSSLFQRLKPSVVSIEGLKRVSRQGYAPFFYQSLPQEKEEHQVTYGSGMVIHPNGYILTCYHVVKEMQAIRIRLGENKRVFQGKLIDAEPNKDLAIIKLSTQKKLPIVQFARSSKTPIGAAVFAIGNPFGFEYTLTKGVLSGKNRNLYTEDNQYKEVLQTDAALNPGNSGGPLFNRKGKVIGMNAIIIPSYQNMGFAIPMETFLPLLKRYGKLKAS